MELIDGLVAGGSLYCVMQPDDAIPEYAPLHYESLALPHIIAKDGRFIAISHEGLMFKAQRCSMFHSESQFFGVYGADGQKEAGDNFFISTIKRFKKRTFILQNIFEKIWDSQDEQDIHRLRHSIVNSRALKVAFIDEDGVWNIHPVILPQIECASMEFLLQTEMINYPQILRDFDALEQFMSQNEKIFKDKAVYRAGMGGTWFPPFLAAYHIAGNGSYKSTYDILRGNTQHEYKRLLIFAENESIEPWRS